MIPLDAQKRRAGRLRTLGARTRILVPTRVEAALTVVTAFFYALSFPDYDLWPLAWIAFVPLMFAIVRGKTHPARAFFMGWATGFFLFYATCWWLSHAIIHYGGFSPTATYILLAPGGVIIGLFPALWAAGFARLNARRGLSAALIFAPFAWAALEWARLGVTGQLWNAIAYSQAYAPALIQPARWGGVYLVGFLIFSVNSAIAFLILKRDARAVRVCAAVFASASLVITAAFLTAPTKEAERASAVVVGIQPNVPVEQSYSETILLMERHLSLSAEALKEWERAVRESSGSPSSEAALSSDETNLSRIAIWPESPMNFRYTRDAGFRETVTAFARTNRASVIFNAIEPAPVGGVYNSAVMLNEEGRLVAQYDKIRLLPFGEYVPIPRWLPAAWMLEGIAGDFTPGAEYPLMPLGEARTGVFICFESAFPSIARKFADEGADVLINISNDGYLGRTPVIRQHLSNVVFRAVETGRPVLRVTNTGVSALITPRGEVQNETAPFEVASRTWTVGRAIEGKTFYTRQGDLFAILFAATSAAFVLSTFRVRRGAGENSRRRRRQGR